MARAFADSRGRYGYRRVKAALGTGVSEKVIRGIMREDGLVARVPGRRRYSSYEGEVTPAPDNLVNRDFTAERPNEKWLTDTTRDQGQRRKGVPFADDRLLRRHGRGAHGRDVAERRTGATRCRVRAAATLRPGERPVVSRRPRLSLPVAGMAGTDGPARPGPVHEREGVQPRCVSSSSGVPFDRGKVDRVIGWFAAV